MTSSSLIREYWQTRHCDSYQDMADVRGDYMHFLEMASGSGDCIARILKYELVPRDEEG
jgi:hypothetical protein